MYWNRWDVRKKTPEGIRLTMKEPEMHGVDVSMKDFSDQTMTLAALAPLQTTLPEFTISDISVFRNPTGSVRF